MAKVYNRMILNIILHIVDPSYVSIKIVSGRRAPPSYKCGQRRFIEEETSTGESFTPRRHLIQSNFGKSLKLFEDMNFQHTLSSLSVLAHDMMMNTVSILAGVLQGDILQRHPSPVPLSS